MARDPVDASNCHADMSLWQLVLELRFLPCYATLVSLPCWSAAEPCLDSCTICGPCLCGQTVESCLECIPCLDDLLKCQIPCFFSCWSWMPYSCKCRPCEGCRGRRCDPAAWCTGCACQCYVCTLIPACPQCCYNCPKCPRCPQVSCPRCVATSLISLAQAAVIIPLPPVSIPRGSYTICIRIRTTRRLRVHWQVSKLLSMLAELQCTSRDKVSVLRKAALLRLSFPFALLPPEDGHVPVLWQGCGESRGCPRRRLGFALPYREQFPLQGPYGLYGME
jgi:hypothetical protein